jgi:N-acetylmuramoyl-L-alanine amidase
MPTYFSVLTKDAAGLYLIENPGAKAVDVRSIRDADGNLNTQKAIEAFTWAKAKGAGTFVTSEATALPLAKIELIHPWVNGGDNSAKPTVFMHHDSHIEIVSDGDTDADGSPRAEAIDPGSGQLQTSLSRPRWLGEGEFVNSETIPYVVIPMNFNETLGLKTEEGTAVDLYDMCRIEWKGKVVYAIVADRGPKDRLGEMSIAAATALGFNVWNNDKTRVVRGLPHGVRYEFIPQTYRGTNYKPPRDADEIKALGQHLWATRDEPPKFTFKGKGILLNPGHGKTDPGALGSNRSITEYALNTLQANYLCDEFRRLGIPYELITQDQTAGYLEPVGAAGKGFDLFVSLHHNAFDGKEHGVEVCVPPVANDLEDKVGTLMCAKISKALGIPNRGLKPRNLAVLRGCRSVGCPGILVESQFVDDERDENEARREAIVAANAILEAIIETFQ